MTAPQQQKHDTYSQSKDKPLTRGQSVFWRLSSKWGFFLFPALFSFFLPHPGCFWLFWVWYPTLLQMSAKGPLNFPFLKGYNKSGVYTKRWSKVRLGLFESYSDQLLQDCEFVRIKPGNCAAECSSYFSLFFFFLIRKTYHDNLKAENENPKRIFTFMFLLKNLGLMKSWNTNCAHYKYKISVFQFYNCHAMGLNGKTQEKQKKNAF